MSANTLEKFQNHTEMEISVLEAMLNDNTRIDDSRLREKHFLDSRNLILFKTIHKLYSKDMEINPMNIVQSSDITIDEVMKVMSFGSSESSFNFYQSKMIDFVEIEEQRRACQEFLRNTEQRNISSESERLMNKIAASNEEKVKPKESFSDLLANRMYEHSIKPLDGISGIDTGFESVNKATDGWQDGDLIVIGARPSLGKTALTLASILNSAKNVVDDSVMYEFFSCEMAVGGVIDRLIAMNVGLPVGAMKNPMKYLPKIKGGLEKYSTSAGELSTLPIGISEETNLALIKAEIRKKVKRNPDKKHLFAIDHLGHVKVDGVIEKREVYTIVVEELKALAKQLGIVIILVVQLNRGVTNREDKSPQLSDIRESGAVEEIADVIIFPHREAYYDKERRGTEKLQEMELIFAKNRQGMVGSMSLMFEPRTNQFHEMERK